MVGRHVGRDGKVEGILYLYNRDQQNFKCVFCILARTAGSLISSWVIRALHRRRTGLESTITIRPCRLLSMVKLEGRQRQHFR